MHRLILTVLLTGLTIAGCDHACTLIGCGMAFQVDLQRAAWTAGNYEVTVIADGETIECTVTLPLDCDAPDPCGGSTKLILGRDGCALPPSQHKLSSVAFADGSAPASVEVRVLQDEVLLGEAVYMPEYSESEPNGPDCGPACKSAASGVLALK